MKYQNNVTEADSRGGGRGREEGRGEGGREGGLQSIVFFTVTLKNYSLCHSKLN